MNPTEYATEDRTGYYYVKGERVALERDPELYAVRFGRGIRGDSPELSPPNRRFLAEESEPVGFIANYGLRIQRTAPHTDAAARADGRVQDLDSDAGIDLAATAYRRVPGSGEAMFTTRHFVVQFRPDVGREQIDGLNSRYGVTTIGPAGYMSNGFVLEAPSGDGPTGPVALANSYVESGLALSATPDFVRQVHYKQTVAAPEAPVGRAPRAAASARGGEFLGRQWHLVTARVTEAWELTIGEPSVVVAVLDDGVDVDHAEFAGKVVGQSDFGAHVSDARPKTADNNHGTACAGVAVATGVKAHGAAPGCSLLAVRTPDFLGVADEAEMFRWVCDEGADVISCSWGPEDGTGLTDPLPDNVRAAISYCVTTGRNGKGIPIVWAAGNGNESVSLDGYAANPDVLAIAASTSNETRAHYSDFGPEIWVCAPSSGSTAKGEKRVFTTDRSGAAGYNGGTAAAGDSAGDYTNDFGGTSSATPLVAGIIGLMLSADPALTADQVRATLRTTAERIGDPTGYDSSGHSPQYGFGRVDARRAVEAVQSRGSGPTGGGTTPGAPTIAAPTAASRSGPAPTYTVNTGADPLFAVEVATRWQLFDGTHDGERDAVSFYGSWQDQQLLSGSSFTLPEARWQELRSADRLYYRVHTAKDQDWTGWRTSLPDENAASAPFTEITAGGLEPASGAGPRISGPARWPRSGGPPTFTVDRAGAPLHAVEVATRSELFDGNHDDERDATSFYGSWQDQQLLSTSSFTLPEARWQQLRPADRLAYRVHTAEDQNWTGWQTSLPDSEAASAPAVVLVAGDPLHSVRRDERGDGWMVHFPLTSFEEVLEPDDDIDYSDPVAGGLVSLLEVRDRLDDRLSDDFAVRELAARRVDVRGELAAYARLDPALVEALQSVRDALGAPISVTSGYRYPALNADVGGASRSQHMAGRAADIRSSAATPLEMARLALSVLGRDIGLGLGANIIHIDVRGEAANWVYNGAALSEAEFDAWVRSTAAGLGRSTVPRLDSAERTRPGIVGPAAVNRSGPAPEFSVLPGMYAAYGVELVDDWRRFAEVAKPMRGDPPGTYASWRWGGLTPSGTAASTTFVLPDDAWSVLRSADRLYYRVVASRTAGAGDRIDDSSTPLEQAQDAPSFPVQTPYAERARISRGATDQLLEPAAVTRSDEARWRDAPG